MMQILERIKLSTAVVENIIAVFIITSITVVRLPTWCVCLNTSMLFI